MRETARPDRWRGRPATGVPTLDASREANRRRLTMRTFSDKPKSPQQTRSVWSGKHHRWHFGHSREVTPILRSHRMINNQTPQTDSSGSSHQAPETFKDMTGKVDTSQPDEKMRAEISGKGEPENKTNASVPTIDGDVAATPPRLTKKTVSSPIPSACGGFWWEIQWELDKKTTKGGWVVQKVELEYDVKDCSDKPFDAEQTGGLNPGWYPLWEAWQIHKDQQVTAQVEGGDIYDDIFGTLGYGKNTHGSVIVKGTAEFYEGLTLPSSFKLTNDPPASGLPSTKSAPTLSGGTGAVLHNLKATWNCGCNDNTTTMDTKIDTA